MTLDPLVKNKGTKEHEKVGQALTRSCGCSPRPLQAWALAGRGGSVWAHTEQPGGGAGGGQETEQGKLRPAGWRGRVR